MSISNKLRGLKEIWHFDNRWYLALTRIFFPGESVNVYRYNGIEVLIDHGAGDANSAREVLTSEMYRQFVSAIEKNGEISVLDLGANNGGFPLLLKAEGFVIKKVVSVELNPNTFARLRFNLERNFRSGAVALNRAVSGRGRDVSISLGSGGASDNIYGNSTSGAGERYQIKGQTFDQIYAENFGGEEIDICKIDVEGAEFEMLEDGNCGFLQKCRYLLMEIHHEENRRRERVLRKLSQSGFCEVGGEQKTGARHYVHYFVNQKLAAQSVNPLRHGLGR